MQKGALLPRMLWRRVGDFHRTLSTALMVQTIQRTFRKTHYRKHVDIWVPPGSGVLRPLHTSFLHPGLIIASCAFQLALFLHEIKRTKFHNPLLPTPSPSGSPSLCYRNARWHSPFFLTQGSESHGMNSGPHLQNSLIHPAGLAGPWRCQTGMPVNWNSVTKRRVPIFKTSYLPRCRWYQLTSGVSDHSPPVHIHDIEQKEKLGVVPHAWESHPWKDRGRMIRIFKVILSYRMTLKPPWATWNSLTPWDTRAYS